MNSTAEKKTGRTLSMEWAERLGRIKNAALVSAVIGFIVQIVGTFLGKPQVAQAGMGMFVFGLPTFLVALFVIRRFQPPPPPPVVQKGPARRPRRKRK